MKKLLTLLFVLLISLSINAQKKDSNYTYGLTIKGSASIGGRNFEAAIKYFTEAVEQNDEHLAEAYSGLALTYKLMKKYDLAKKNYQQAVKFDKSGSGDMYYKFAQFTEERGNQKEADGYYKKIYDINSYSAKAYSETFRRRAEDSRYSKEKGWTKDEIEKALEYYRKAILVHPFLVENYHSKGKFQREIGKSDDAILTYKQILSLPSSEVDDQEKAEAYLLMAEAYYENHNDDGGDQYYKKALSLYPSLKSSITLSFYEKARKLKGENLESHLRRWDVLLPKDGIKNYTTGLHHITLKDYSRAVKYLNEAISSNSNTYEYFVGRAVAYDAWGKQENKSDYYQKSVDDWSVVLEMGNASEQVYFSRAGTMQKLFNLKYKTDKSADKELAAKIIKDLDNVIAMDDKHAHAYEMRGRVNFILNGEVESDDVKSDLAMHDKYCPSKQK